MANEPEETRLKQIFIYVNWTSAAILLIVLATFFVPIPTANSKYVDIAIGILLGILSSNSGTITGAQSTGKKPDQLNPVKNADNVTINPPVQ